MQPVICNGVAIYRGAIKHPQSIIDVVESVLGNELNTKFSWKKASVVNPNGTTSISTIRTNSDFALPTLGNDIFCSATRYVNNFFHESFTKCLIDFLFRFNIEVDIDKSKYYSILKYGISEHYIHHLDDGEKTPRKVSAVGYLNNDFIGGNLDFDKIKFNYPPSAGDIVIFPSVAPYSHSSMPVIEGTKYSVVNWWS
jgi:hypothetical protein